jgi:hypothetical protein
VRWVGLGCACVRIKHPSITLTRFSSAGELPGGCRTLDSVLPLHNQVMYGHPLPIPAQSERLLEEMYGFDWRVPRPKGYKSFLCPPVWKTGTCVFGVARVRTKAV